MISAFALETPPPEVHAGRAAALCRRWQDRHDISAAARLAKIHRQLVVEIAECYAPEGQPSEDLIAEGQIGLMQAICRFDPDAGEDFSAYAARYVRAAVRDHVVHHASERVR